MFHIVSPNIKIWGSHFTLFSPTLFQVKLCEKTCEKSCEIFHPPCHFTTYIYTEKNCHPQKICWTLPSHFTPQVHRLGVLVVRWCHSEHCLLLFHAYSLCYTFLAVSCSLGIVICAWSSLFFLVTYVTCAFDLPVLTVHKVTAIVIGDWKVMIQV